MKRITTDEVKKLPVGSLVDIVFEKSGIRQACRVKLMQTKYRVLECVKEDGSVSSYPVINYSGAHYEVEE